MDKAMRRWLTGVGLVVTATTGLLATSGLVYRLGVKQTQRRKVKTQQRSIAENTQADNAWYLKQSPEEWRVQTPDGLILRASFIGQPESHKTVILAHGLGHSREQMIPFARLFQSLGYQVLMPDARAHGQSDGTTIGYGWLDRFDYRQWIDQVIARTGQAATIVLFGISMGAATVMATAGEDLPKNVVAIIEDSGYANVLVEGRHRLATRYHFPARPTMDVVDRLSRLDAGYRLVAGDIAGQLRKSDVPILMLHGTADRTVPVANLYELAKGVSGPKRVFELPGVAHIDGIHADPEGYRAKIKEFLSTYDPDAI